VARGLVLSIHNINLLCLLKLYRKIFEHCAPIIKMMQKPTLDAVLVRSMLKDFQRFLATLGFEKIWTETLEADPNFPSHVLELDGGEQKVQIMDLRRVGSRLCALFKRGFALSFRNKFHGDSRILKSLSGWT